MAGRNLRSRVAVPNLKHKQTTSSSENTDSDSDIKKGTSRMRQGRNILGDQTNTKTSSKVTELEESLGTRRAVRARRGDSDDTSKHTRASPKRKNDSSESYEGGKKIQARERNTRTTSVKENDSEDEFVIARPRPAGKQHISALVDTGVNSSTKNKKNSTNEGNKTQNISSFYGSPKTAKQSPVALKKTPPLSSPKICVYKTKLEAPAVEKPKSEVERLALYEFEIDSTEEINPKKKKTRIVKPRQTQKPKTKSKPAKNPKTVLHGVKKVRTPRKVSSNSSVKSKNTVNFRTVEASTSSKHQSNTSSVAVPPLGHLSSSPSTSKSKPKTIVKPSAVDKLSRNTKRSSNTPSAASTPLHPIFAPAVEQFSPPDDMCVSPPSPAEIPLQNLFEEQDESSLSISMRVSARLGPTRFEYEELAKARAKMKARRNNHTAKIAVQPKLSQSPSKSKETGLQEKSSLRQTSIRNFLGGNEQPGSSQGLFSTGASVDHHILVSSTPQRQKKGMLPPLSPLLSPVVARTEDRRQSPRKSNQISSFKTTEASSSPRKSPRKVSNSAMFSCSPVKVVTPVKSSTPQRASPTESPYKVTNGSTSETATYSPGKVASPAKPRMPQKALTSKTKPQETTSPSKTKNGPTRLSVTTLREILKNNAKSESAPPLLTADISEMSLQENAEEKSKIPESPQRTFQKPARKSYERRRVVRPALNFMELDQEEDDYSDQELEEKEEKDGEDEDIPKTHKTIHRKQKQPDQEKEFEKWASRFNSELDELQDFTLEID